MLTKARNKRKIRIKSKFSGTAKTPRISVFRSNKSLYVQAIDDAKSVTLASAKGNKAEEVGKKLAANLTKAKVKSVVFDRSGYRYHGRVKLLAESLREAGLRF